jgi:ribosomal protein S18 acetylase RimI-like enzyme
MPHITDRDEIRRILNLDPIWAAYPLGDLSPSHFAHCEWRRHGDAFALVFRRYEIPILWATGGGPDLARILHEVGEEPRLDLQVRPEALAVLEERYQWQHLKTMRRMAVRPAAFRPGASKHGVERLSMQSLPDVERLYADGASDGTSPDYFFPSMLAEGVFFGVRLNGELVSIAGTHVLAMDEGVAAVGNVYTRRDCRGQGYGTAAASAVVNGLFGMGIGIAALNVNVENGAAIRVYESLGFRAHCQFREGAAERRKSR